MFIKTVPIKHISEVKVGDRVFWYENRVDDTNYTAWAGPKHPHPKYPNGYEIFNIREYTIEVLSHHNDKKYYFNCCYFVKAIDLPKFETNLEKELYEIQNMGYAKKLKKAQDIF